ncbi:hypothetical protein BLAT2472_90118 [Burkholderia latens]
MGRRARRAARNGRLTGAGTIGATACGARAADDALAAPVGPPTTARSASFDIVSARRRCTSDRGRSCANRPRICEKSRSCKKRIIE